MALAAVPAAIRKSFYHTDTQLPKPKKNKTPALLLPCIKIELLDRAELFIYVQGPDKIEVPRISSLVCPDVHILSRYLLCLCVSV
jgi:hypothetical protein